MTRTGIPSRTIEQKTVNVVVHLLIRLDCWSLGGSGLIVVALALLVCC
jgi:hypothetical protein